jgi:Tfp pilus assembly protein PilN
MNSSTKIPENRISIHLLQQQQSRPMSLEMINAKSFHIDTEQLLQRNKREEDVST